MRTYTDGERFGVETDPHDAELARAAAAIVSDAKELAKVSGVFGTGQCDMCGQKERLRGFPIYTDGQYVAAKICAACQREKTEQARKQYDNANPDTPPSEREE